jgi:hypothetical protein
MDPLSDDALDKVSPSDLKNETQTQTGLVKEVKKEIIPGTDEMAKLAVEKYESETGDLSPQKIENNFNNLIKNLIKTETEIYEGLEENFVNEIVPYFIEKYHSNDSSDSYPTIQSMFENVETAYDDSDSFEEFITEGFERLYPFAGYVYFSASQGRKTRVGDTLENHVELLLTRMGYPLESQVEIGGSPIDIILPNKETFNQNPENAIFLPCQTTLKDRYRLSLSKLPSGDRYDPVSKYITTATGINLITDDDQNDITRQKIDDTVDAGYKFLAFNEVKQQFPTNEGIVSYTEFINEILPEKAESWDMDFQGNITDF